MSLFSLAFDLLFIGQHVVYSRRRRPSDPASLGGAESPSAVGPEGRDGAEDEPMPPTVDERTPLRRAQSAV